MKVTDRHPARCLEEVNAPGLAELWLAKLSWAENLLKRSSA